jgi:hypothetical protein
MVAPGPNGLFSEAHFLDAAGVLVGQSGGMKKVKSSKSNSRSCSFGAPDPNEFLLGDRFLDVTGVLVGQSGGMKKVCSPKSKLRS